MVQHLQASLMKLYRFAIIFDEYYHNFSLSFPFCGMISKKEIFASISNVWKLGSWKRREAIICSHPFLKKKQPEAFFNIFFSVVLWRADLSVIYQFSSDLTTALTLIRRDENIRDHRMCQHQQNDRRYALVIHFYGFTCVLIKLGEYDCARDEIFSFSLDSARVSS